MTFKEKNKLKDGDIVWIDVSGYDDSVQKLSTQKVQQRIGWNMETSEFYTINPQKSEKYKQVKVGYFNPSSQFIEFILYNWLEPIKINIHHNDIHNEI